MVQAINTGANENHEQTAAPEGHDEKMAEKFDQTQEAARSSDTTTGESKEGDELILGKFKSPEDLAAAYQELEAKLSGKGGEQESDTSEVDKDSSQEEIDKAAEEAVDRAEGVDMESLSKEYFENGTLADESYQALEKAGIPRDVVDQFIEGQEARATQIGSQIVEQIGGQDKFDGMIEWASANLDEEFLDSYNAEVESGDPRRMEQAVKALAYEYSQARPTEPNLMGGQGQGGQNIGGFQSMAQVTEAMSDPRYQKDPAFRAEVEKKLAASSIL